MRSEDSNDLPITRTIKIVYEAGGAEYEAVPATDQELQEAAAAGLTLDACE
jgi:hypothetical protein